MTEDKTYNFRPDDGHVHQYLNGICAWCGAPPADNPLVALAEGAREAGAEVTEVTMEAEVFATDPDTVTEVTIDMQTMLKQARVFTVDGRPDTLMAFSIRPLEDAEIERFAGEAQKVLEWAKTLEITDGTSAKLVAGDLRSIAMLRRGVDLRAKDLITPLADVLKDMKEDLKKVTNPLAEADQIGRRKVSDWVRSQEEAKRAVEEANRKAQEAFDAARELRDKGEESPDLSTLELHTVPAAPAMIRPDGGGTVSMVDHWSAEVTDKSQVPSEYMEPNMQMLNLMARQQKGNNPIPGVKWVNNPTPLVR